MLSAVRLFALAIPACWLAILAPSNGEAEEIFKLRCRPDRADFVSTDPIMSVDITMSNAFLDPAYKIGGRETISIVHTARSGKNYERYNQYDIKSVASDERNMTWSGTLSTSPSLSMSGMISDLFSDRPRYVERVADSTDGQPPRVVTSTTCRPLIAPHRPDREPPRAEASSPPPLRQPPAAAQPAEQQAAAPPPPANIACASVADAEQRLNCYDKAFGQSAGRPSPAQDSRTAAPAQVSRTAAPSDETAKAAVALAPRSLSVAKDSSGSLWRFRITSHANGLTIENVVANGGSCPAQGQRPRLPQPLEPGQTLEYGNYLCNPLEVLVTTDQGSEIFRWRE
jgi:hypothetical protein